MCTKLRRCCILIHNTHIHTYYIYRCKRIRDGGGRAGDRVYIMFCKRQTSFAASATNTRVNKPVPVGGGAVTSLSLTPPLVTRLSVRIRIHFFLFSCKTRENTAVAAAAVAPVGGKKKKLLTVVVRVIILTPGLS